MSFIIGSLILTIVVIIILFFLCTNDLKNGTVFDDKEKIEFFIVIFISFIPIVNLYVLLVSIYTISTIELKNYNKNPLISLFNKIFKKYMS